MEFKKYPSIENHYYDREIKNWLHYNPELEDETYIIQEKIHGSNFQILITPDDIKFASRKQMLDSLDGFFNANKIMESISDELDKLIRYSRNFNFNIRVYGEIYGKGIQKGVYYGEEKGFKIFDMEIDDELLSQESLALILDYLGILHLFVPVLGVIKSLHEALKFDTEKNSTLSDKEDNIMEGVVIKPYYNVYQNPQGSVFYIKKKNDAFKEKQKEKRRVTDPSEGFSEEVNFLAKEFKDYLTENRVHGIFSKDGKIADKTQIGKYVRLVIDDAIEDIVKDFELNLDNFTKQERKFIFNGGQIVSKLLMKEL